MFDASTGQQFDAAATYGARALIDLAQNHHDESAESALADAYHPHVWYAVIVFVAAILTIIFGNEFMHSNFAALMPSGCHLRRQPRRQSCCCVPCSSILLHIVINMLPFLRAHFHRRNHTTATGSACSGDNATTSCAAAAHTVSQPQSQRTLKSSTRLV